MTLTVTVVLPRLALPKPAVRTLLPVAAPLVLAAADATGVGLLGRVLLSGLLSAAEEAVRA